LAGGAGVLAVDGLTAADAGAGVALACSDAVGVWLPADEVPGAAEGVCVLEQPAATTTDNTIASNPAERIAPR
jgi:hypothetical protein